MSEKESFKYHDEAYEYAFEKVPADKRKNLLSLIVVLGGYPIALSNFVIGGTVGVGLSFQEAILTLLIGNGVLISIVIFVGLLAYKTGLSSSMLSRNSFGKSGSFIFSILIILNAIVWNALNGDIFARMIDTTFSWWFIPVPITAALVIFMWLLSAVRGYKGLLFISALGVPAALILSAYGVYRVGVSTNGFSGVFSYIPVEPLTFSVATASIVGGWVFGATITPDISRYGKSKLHVVIAGLIAFLIGCFGFQLSGALIAMATGISDFVEAMAALGIGLMAFFTAIFTLWTTQDNDIYAGSLALQNIIKETNYYGKIRHKHVAFLIALVAAIFAAGGIYEYIMPIIQVVSFLIPSISAIMIAEGYFIKKSKSNILLNNKALIAWGAGAVFSYLAFLTNFFIPPIIGMLTSGVLYIVLEKYFSKEEKNLKGETTQVG